MPEPFERYRCHYCDKVEDARKDQAIYNAGGWRTVTLSATAANTESVYELCGDCALSVASKLKDRSLR